MGDGGGATVPDAVAADAFRARALSGADAFARVLDRESRREGGPGFVSHALLTLDRRPDAGAIREALAADTPLGRGARSRLRSWLPFVLPRRVPGGPPAADAVEELPAPPAGGEPWLELAHRRLDPGRGENLRVTVFPAGDGTWRAAYVFQHLLMDARGAERVLAALGGGGGGAASWARRRSLLGDAGLGRTATLAREQLRAMDAVAARPIHVVCDVGARPTGPARGRSVLLDGAATADAVAAGRRAAGYAMEGLWYLAALLAADRDTDPRPAAPGSTYVIPLPVTLDRKGEETRCFGNHVVFHFLPVPVAEARDPAVAARTLREVLMERLRARSDLLSEAQMEFCRLVPPAIYAALARSAFQGSLGSLFFTNPGPVCPGLERLAGAVVTDFRHFPVPPAHPGLCGTAWTFRGRLGLSVTWVPGRVEDGRAAALLDRWVARVRGGA